MKDQKHVHTYDEHGQITCCSLEDKIYIQAGATDINASVKQVSPKTIEEHDHDHGHSGLKQDTLRKYLPAILSLVMLLAGMAADNFIQVPYFKGYIRLAWYLIAYSFVAWQVILDAFRTITKGEIFTEFFLMTLATIGAFAIGEYPEAVAVMLFYNVGELFQSAAVNRAKRSIKALLDIRPDMATIEKNGELIELKPEAIAIDDELVVKAGEKIAVDGVLISGSSSFNTSALTGESKPRTIKTGETVLAGMINFEKLVRVRVNKPFSESSLARILELVQNAASRKAKTELLIRKFAKVYTPAVVFLAVLVVLIPYFVVDSYVFSEWLYRALIFLVISCPCALVISIPLGYFGGIGAASRNGVLFKGSNYLDLIANVNTVVMDKTGTLTKGVFRVQKAVSIEVSEEELISVTAALESNSTHPVASAILEYARTRAISYQAIKLSDVEEIAGHGLKARYNGKLVLAGNVKLLRKYDISYDRSIEQVTETIVCTAIDGALAGYFTIADEIKEDAGQAIEQMVALGVTETVMLSGDKSSVTSKVAAVLKVTRSYGDLLPEHKVQKIEELKKDPARIIAFVGDGINDAPVLALSDVGIAMGGLGSDAAIETADVIIQTDEPSKIATAIRIGRKTRQVVKQNIALAFVVKAIVLALGAGGLATMWEAVFADVGVALLAILNAVRIQRMMF